MNHQHLALSRRYQTALRAHLRQGRPAGLESARGLGHRAFAAGLRTLDLAKLHERILVTKILPDGPISRRITLIKRAGDFFAAALTPVENTPHPARNPNPTPDKIIGALSRHTADLVASNLELSLEIARRKTAERALKQSEQHHATLAAQSRRLQMELRRLSRQLLAAQEDERKKISRELHDVIVQTLTGINVQLATLKTEAAHNTRGLDRNIATTQRLVEGAVHIVHEFARELRPAVLDDLGLIPALRSHLDHFKKRTGISTRLTVDPGEYLLDTTQRTVLYRVAQEALTNVYRHARARRVELTLTKFPDRTVMTIRDNGRSFQLHRVLHSRSRSHLGLLGMQERVEMVGGRFEVDSVLGRGTTIIATLPVRNPIAERGNETQE